MGSAVLGSAGLGLPTSCADSSTALLPSRRCSVDERSVLRRSHDNPVIQRLYAEFLEKPNSHKVGDFGAVLGGFGGWAWAGGLGDWVC